MQFFETSPIIQHIEQILESPLAPLLLVLLILAVFVMGLLIAFRAYRLLLFMLLIGQMFSQVVGASQGLLTLMRFAALFALAALSTRGLNKTGVSSWILFVYAVYMLLLLPFSDFPEWSLQRSIAFGLLALGLAGATAGYVADLDRVPKVVMVITLAGLLWLGVNVVFGASGGPERGSGEARYVGFVGSSGALANVGGFLPPFLLWGFLRFSKRLHKYVCLVGLLISLPMLVYVGQRIGLFSAIVGLTPLLWFRLGFKRLVGGLTFFAVAGALSVVLLNSVNPTTKQYVLDKFIYRVGYLSNRDIVWVATLQRCMQSPIVGHGTGAADAHSAVQTGMGVHNSYLALWYDGGVLAPLLWISVIILSVSRSLRLLGGAHPPGTKDDVRVLFGCMLALSSEAFFESTLASPTNLNAGLFILCAALIDRIRTLTAESAQYASVAYGWPGSGGNLSAVSWGRQAT